MDVRTVLRVSGFVGFIILAVTTYFLTTYFVLPRVMPIVIHEVESSLESEGISVTPSMLSSIESTMSFAIIVGSTVGLPVGWLIMSAVMMGLLRVFRVGAGFLDTWLISGNYFYIGVIFSAITALTPLLNYEVSAMAAHKSVLLMPPLLGLNIASAIIGSLLLAYLFSRVYNAGFVKTFVPILISLLIFIVISVVFSF
jgi:hypothetical protein